MTDLTFIQCHFVRGRINHRLRFGEPDTTLQLDKYRKLVGFEPQKRFGYIRWRANAYGTQDWRFYILKSQTEGLLTSVPGISPGVKLLAGFIGTQSVRRALKAFDQLENNASEPPEMLPDGFWFTFQTDLYARQSADGLTLNQAHRDAHNVG